MNPKTTLPRLRPLAARTSCVHNPRPETQHRSFGGTISQRYSLYRACPINHPHHRFQRAPQWTGSLPWSWDD